MSHVTTIDIEIKDLKALAVAAKDLGLELKLGQKTYKWYGSHVGDYPLPAGFNVSDLGQCEHALVDPNNRQAYEVGVVQRRDGGEGWTLIYDFWAGGQGMSKKTGSKCEKVKQAYAAEVARKQLKKRGWKVKKTMNARGEVVLTGSKLS